MKVMDEAAPNLNVGYVMGTGDDVPVASAVPKHQCSCSTPMAG
jgi:hypothetical protein